MQGLGAQDVPQCGLGQQPSAVVGILHIGHGDRGIWHSIVDDGICMEIRLQVNYTFTKLEVLPTETVTESRVRTSWGGTSSVIVRRSTFW